MLYHVSYISDLSSWADLPNVYMKTSQCLSLCLCSARRCQEGLLHGLQRGEAGVHEGGQQQGRGVSDGRPAEEASREGGQVQTGQSEGENAARRGSRGPVGTSPCKGSQNGAKSRSALSEGVSD